MYIHYYIIMTTKISTWGNSLGLRLPKSLLIELGLSAGSEIHLYSDADGKIILDPVRKTPSLKEMLKNVNPKNLHPEYWTDVPQGREIW